MTDPASGRPEGSQKSVGFRPAGAQGGQVVSFSTASGETTGGAGGTGHGLLRKAGAEEGRDTGRWAGGTCPARPPDSRRPPMEQDNQRC